MTRPIVLDASAAIDAMWTARPQWGLALSALQSACSSVAPSLLAHEVAHVVHVKRRREFPGTADDRAEVVAGILDGIELVDVDAAAARRIGKIAEAHGVTAYDAAYIDAAERRAGSVLVTQDARLARAAAARLGSDGCMDLDAVVALVAKGEL